VTLPAAPSPQVATQGQAIDGIDILGVDLAAGGALAPGAKVDLHVYFHVNRATAVAYRFGIAAWPVDDAAPGDPAPGDVLRTGARTTADGAFASDHWKPGDYIRERFTLTVPRTWHGSGVAIGLFTTDPSGGKIKATGATLASDPFVAILGVLPVGPAPR
jgi:hypothetical protein